VAPKVRECLGWKATDEGQAVTVGFKTDKGDHLTLAFDEAALKETLSNLIQALSTFKNERLKAGERLYVETSWLDFGLTSDGSTANMAVYLSGGGDLAFRFPPM
jgi:hypothetical protein